MGNDMKNAIFIMLIASFAYAGVTLRSQDLPPDLSISNSFTVNGSQNLGLNSNAQIQALTCSGGLGACHAFSSTEGDMYISTGTVAGQFRNARTGKGPQ